MADKTPADEKRPRSEAFFAQLGLPSGFYTSAIEGAVQHALAAPRDANPSPWTPYGSRNLGGRIRALSQDPQNPATIYAGLAQGGVFKSTDGGDTWTPLGRPQDAFPVGALAVAPGSPGRLYVGTGEPGGLHDDLAGTLVPREITPAGLGFFRWDESLSPPGFVREVGRVPAVGRPANGAANGYARIAVDPDDRERCWIASNTGLWRREAGPIFHREPIPAQVPTGGSVGNVASDVVVVRDFDPGHPGRHRLYAAIGTVGIFRGVWDPNAGAVTWEAQPLENGLPDPSVSGDLTFDRVRIAVSRSDPRHIYATMGAHDPQTQPPQDSYHVLAVYHSDDGGDHWQERQGLGLHEDNDIGGFTWVNLCIAVHPDNPALVVAGAVNLARSRDFGKTWEVLMEWTNFNRGDRAQHSDQHDLFFDVANPERLWVANDGGVSIANDIVEGNPHTDLSWRKRSHGLIGAQYNDITVHPSYPFIMGGGLQDNGTYVGFGGPTWYASGDADGGQIAFDLNNPRRLIAPNQALLVRSTIQSGSATEPVPGAYPMPLRGLVCADQAAPDDMLAWRLELTGFISHAALFIAVVSGHPTTSGHLLVGRVGAAYFSNDFGNSFTDAGIGVGFGAGDVGATAYGSGAAPGADWWIGTTAGRLHLGTGAIPKAWNNVATAAMTGLPITNIVVHPGNDNYVAAATAGISLGPPQGRVFLTIDQGANWADITGLVAHGAPPGGAPPLQSLPPSPITSLVFDPTVPVGSPQCLFAGTLAGVYVIRNLPAANAAAGAVPAFNPQWFSFNNGWTPPDAFHPVVAAGTNYTRERTGVAPAAGGGTIASSVTSDIVTGTGTTFLALFQPGDVIRTTGLARDQARVVAVVIDDTHLSTVHQAPVANRFTPALAAGTSFVIDTGSGQPTAGTGTIASGAGTDQVTGTGTLFTAEVHVGDMIRTTGLAENQEKEVAQVIDNLHLFTRFHQPAGELPLVLVKSLALVTIPATPGAPAGSLESAPRQRLLAAVYGRGIWECDLTPTNALAAGYPAGGPRHRLFVRQHVVEDGLTYPRPTPATLNLPPAAGTPNLGGDPRMPPATVNFTDTDAFDIRVDRAPFQFFEDVIDGVEFDEDLRSKTVKPGEPHVVYVQVHSRGWDHLAEVHVRLFFAPAPAPGAAPLPDLHVGFWASHTAVPLPAAAPADAAAPRAAWRRVKDHRTLTTVGPNQPAVARFDWIPPADLGGHVALLAVATSAIDPLPAGLPEVMATLIRQQRRVALRVVVAEPFAPDVFVRDGVDDAGAVGGVTFGGRSPDIVVVDAPPPNSPEQDFADRLDPRTGDRIDPSKPNIVYVRVHNRSSLETQAEVELFWVKANVPTATPAADAPPFDQGQWNRIDAANVDVPANGSAFARINWPQAVIPDLSGDPFQALTLIALVRATTGPDIRPDRTRISDLDTFWRFFRVLRDSNNAAMRTVLYKV